ncbi:UL-16 binding protein 5-like [Meles meles]|uniref:UL-16 binding protein 5-like n=1 Tax=Meles meles TaxID=9662 RepID=UPI001E69D315|nr:UL-16 binding protein 5-like [Meles meles]
MAWTRVSSVRLGLLLTLSLRLCATPGSDHALPLYQNHLMTSPAGPGQWRCEIQVQVNGNKVFHYNCGSKEVKPIGPCGVKLMKLMDTQREPLKDLGEELRKKVLDINAEIFTRNDSLTMQGNMMCERGADGHTRRSWRFAFNGQLTYLFDAENRKWTVVPPGGQQFRGTLDNDEELTTLLVRTSNGDCKSWLQHVWEHCDETRETTVPPATRQDTAPGKATAIGPCTWIFPLLLSCAVIMGILV